MLKVLLPLLFALGVLADSTPAYAIASCYLNNGVAPRTGTVLPPRARVLAFDERMPYSFTAKLDGKPVALKVTKLASAPYTMQLLEVDSAKTGTLVISRVQGKQAFEVARYTVKADAKMPADVKATTRRLTQEIRHTTVKEKYDALAIDIGNTTPAVLATIKIRRDAKAAWSTLQAPVSEWEKTTTILIGELGCTQNYSVGLLENGVEIELAVTLVDGTTRAVALPAPVKI